VQPDRHGQLFLAGDAAHIVPPTRAKGLNLAIADVSLLAPALTALINKRDPKLADAYSEAALQRLWRCTHFSWWDDQHAGHQRRPVRRRTAKVATALGVQQPRGRHGACENYAGLPLSVG